MRIAITKCYSCICNACTRFRCPYPHLRCYTCTNLDMKRIYDCDWFENKHTAPRRFRVKRRSSRSRDDLNAKLDFLLENLGLVAPKLVPSGTYAVVCDGSELFKGPYDEAIAWRDRYQRYFEKPFVLKQVTLDL